MVDFVPFPGMAATDNNTQYQANSVITTANSGTVIAATSMVIVPSSGNVGIGTTNPSAGLDSNVSVIFRRPVGIGTVATAGINANVVSIYGTAMNYGNIVLGNVTAGGVGIYFPDGTYQTTAASGTGTGASNYGNANVANFLSGNVLVGNLYIGNSTVSTSTTTGALIVNGGAGIGGNISVGGNISGVNTLFAVKIGIGTTTALGTANTVSIYGNENLYGNLVLNNSTGNNSGIFFSDSTFQNTAAINYSNANVANFLSGNVLIGNLYIGNGTISTSTTTGALIINGGAGIGGNVYAGGNVVAASMQPISASLPPNGIFLPAANSLGFASASAERMRITGQGDIGMGTTTPVNNGGSYVTLTLNGATSGILQIQATGSNAGQIFSRSNTNLYVTAFNATVFETNGANERMRITANGNLQIGTATQTINPTAVEVINNINGGGTEWVNNNSGGGNVSALSTGGLAFGTFTGAVGSEVPTERMRINSSGNVGIGTTSTSAPLVVAGSATAVSGTFAGGNTVVRLQSLVGNSFSEPAIDFGESTLLATARIASKNEANGGGSLIFINRDTSSLTSTLTERMRINSSGDVQIGTSADAGNTLRYLDVQNTNVGTSAGAIIRLITNNAAGSATTTVDIVKYKNGQFVLNNNDSAGYTTFGTAGTERMRITNAGNINMGTTTSVGYLTLQRGGSASSAPDIATGDGTQSTYINSNWASGSYNPYVQAGDHGIIFHNGSTETGQFVISQWSSIAKGLRINTSGNVAMANNLTVTGEVYAYYSDRRLKDNIEPISNAINIINSISGVYYNANDLAVELLREDKTARKVGVLAQEIQAVMPEVVRQAPFDIAADGSSISGENYQTVQYDKLVPLLIQAVKEQSVKIAKLEKRIAVLERDS